MTHDEAIKWLSDELMFLERPNVNKGSGLEKKIAVCQMAIDAIREQEERENPNPLALDELLKMHGEPVWVVVSDRALGWYLVDADCECVFRQNGGCTFDEIVNHGAAYRSKPKEDKL